MTKLITWDNLRPYQKECVERCNSMESGSHLVQMATGLGKCFAAGTPILMYDGSIKSIETISEGELVMGWDSTPRRVVGVTSGREEMYRVDRIKHDSYTVNASHILSLRMTNFSNLREKRTVDSLGRKYRGGDVCNIEVKDYIKCSDNFKHIAKGFCAPVTFTHKSVPVDPYFVGVWLGDGRANSLTITTLDCEIENYLEGFAAKNNFVLVTIRGSHSGKAQDYRLKGGPHNAPARRYMRETLYNNKHIPKAYLANSADIRLELLAGLLDTDGYLHSQDRSTFEFCTQYKQLQTDVAFLCRSLGLTARCFTKHNKKYDKDYYYVCIFGNTAIIPTKVARKKASPNNIHKDNLVHGIDVVPVGMGTYYGFELEGPDRMFLLGDCTVVHNTVVFSQLKRLGRTLVLAHREELINQPVKYFDCPVGFEQAGRRSNGEEVVCASVQSLVRRLDKFSPDAFDMIITDEAHHAVAPSYKKIYDYFKPRVHFGFTATPNRGDKQGLGQIYEDIIYEKDIRWGIANNYLTDIKCFRIDIGFDITKVKRNRDDYNLHDLAAAVDITEQNEAVAEAYRQYHVGQTLIFATTVQHAHNIADLIPGAVVVSAETPNREEIIEAFTKREIPCIVNCMVFTEGTDMPLVETIIIARPTKNSALYTQMVGRGLRLYPGKDHLVLLDCVGASGKNDICTAPDLFGIKITKKQYESISKNDEGIMLTEIEPELNKHYAWKINATEINLFEKEKNVSTHGVNFTKLPSGGFLLSMSGYLDRIIGEDGKPHLVRQAKEGAEKKTVYVGIKILVSAPDLLDKSRIVKEVRVENQFKREVSEPMDIGIAFGTVWRTLNKTEIYQPFRKLWDRRGNIWEYDLASDKQKALIKRKMNPKLIAGVDYDTLTKGEAGRILDILSGNNVMTRF